MSRSLLVVGVSGQLGRRVAAAATAAGWQVAGIYHTHPPQLEHLAAYPLDILDRTAVERLFDLVRPQAVIHTAALVSEPRFWETNADGAAHVAAAASARGIRLLHMSSDALFDGRHSPYTEQHSPMPITPYGASKAAAETAVRALAPAAAIVRTSLIVDDDPLDKHSRMILDIAAGRRPEALFTDEIRCPVPAADLASALIEIVDKPISGLLNVAGADALSRYELGVLVARRYGVDPNRLPATTLAASGLHRPADVRLDLTRARTLLSTRLRGAREFLAPP
jgi:dTDP-4-dehydrorhamnose reductase